VDDGPSITQKPRAVDLMREQEKFSRHKVEQLAIVKEASILVSLSNSYVSIHDLQTYELQETLARTKGASVFAVTSNIVKDLSTAVPSIVSRLAVAVKRKLLLWSWQDMELTSDTAELNLVTGIKTLTWATGTKLIAGLSSSYVLVDVQTSAITDIVGPGSIGGAPGQDGGRFGGVGMAGMGYIGMAGMAPKPLATRLSDGELLLAKDINTLFIDTNGNPLKRRQIPWSVAPEAIGYSYPYLLALQSSKGTLEIRNPETHTLLQTISLPNASHLHVPQPNVSLAHAGKGFLVTSERCIWRMKALEYDAQIDELVEGGKLDEAISLLGMLEDALLKDKEGRLREIKMRKAQSLFDQRKFRASIELFTDVSAPPERVIRLYPPIISGSISQAIESQKVQTEDGLAKNGDGISENVRSGITREKFDDD
jgi:Vam6/Vps39-like protein vacuolar protein sorting-associated protein 39